MTCSEFLTRFSEFHDGELGLDADAPFHRHVETCASCRRYSRVVERGGEVLRAAPLASPRDDFRDRLQHSIYLLDEERRRRRISGNGSGLATFVVVAAVAATVMMTPVLRGGDAAVSLPAIVVDEPVAVSSVAGTLGRGALEWAQSAAASPNALPVSLEDPELWSQSNALLYRHSSLYSKHRETTLVRAGLR